MPPEHEDQQHAAPSHAAPSLFPRILLSVECHQCASSLWQAYVRTQNIFPTYVAGLAPSYRCFFSVMSSGSFVMNFKVLHLMDDFPGVPENNFFDLPWEISASSCGTWAKLFTIQWAIAMPFSMKSGSLYPQAGERRVVQIKSLLGCCISVLRVVTFPYICLSLYS